MERILKKYHDAPQAVKASYWFVICNVFQKGLAFITIPFYTRLLSTTEYGTYSVYTTWFNIIAIFASLNISAGFFNVGVLKYENEKDRFLSSVQGLGTLSTVIVFTLCFALYRWFYQLTSLSLILVIIMSIQTFFYTPLLYWSALQRFEYKYTKVIVVTMLSSIATVIMSLILISLMQDKSYSLILGTAIVQISIGIFFYIYNLVKGKCFYDKYIWRYAASFGITLIPHYLSYSILNSSDRVMINNMCSTSDAGIYSLACQISIAVNLVTSAIDASMNPWVFQKLKQREYKDISKITNYILLVFGVVVIGCSLAAPEVLLIVAPMEYHSAKWVMPPVIIGCFYLYLAGCFMRVAFYQECKRIITLSSVFAAVLNIILNYLFIPRYGFIAAAYTTLISYMVFAGMHYIAMHKICTKNSYASIPFDGKLLVLISLFTTLGSLSLLLLYPRPLIRYGLVCLIILITIINKKKILRIYSEINGGK